MMTDTDQTVPAPDRGLPGWIVSLACAILLGAHIVLRSYYGSMKDGLDAVALGLAVVGLSPWIATIFKSLKVGGMEVQFQDIKDKVTAQGHEIDEIKFLILNFLPRWELAHLENLASSEPFMIDLEKTSPEFEGELRHLRGLGFIEHKTDIGITKFIRGEPRRKDMHNYFRLTSVGQQYLKHRADNLVRARSS